MAAQYNPMTGEWEQANESTSVDYSDPNAAWNQNWGDETYENLGRVSLGVQSGIGGNYGRAGQALRGGGLGTSHSYSKNGVGQYGVDSLETAQRP